jgi:DNA-binding CsgD family transcriptional regulator
MFREAVLLLKRNRAKKIRTLQVRLFAFFALFAIALVGAGFLLLTMAGVFNAAGQRHITWLDNETGHLQELVSSKYSELSLRGVAFAKTVMTDTVEWARRNDASERELTSRPDLLESLLSEQAGNLLAALDNNTCSGAFIILDASMDGAFPDETTKRAGLYFRRTETNNVTAIASQIYSLRGPAAVARENGADLVGQWRSGFDLNGMDFFVKTLDAARQNKDLDLSRLYYWSSRYQFEGDSEHYMLLCVPMIAGDGTVYGICGLEMSAMMFKNLYTPARAEYPRVFTSLAPLKGGSLDTGAGLVAGSAYMSSWTNGLLTPEGFRRGISMWSAETGDVYTGRMEPLVLYPMDSPFANEEWALAVLMPGADWQAAANQSNTSFYGTFAALLFVSLFAAVFISKRYIRPVVETLESIQSDERGNLPKTRITEIDDLLEYLAEQDKERRTLSEEKESLAAELEREKNQREMPVTAPVNAAYEQFIKNLETLTASERDVFNLYMKNKTAQQIADLTFVSINTVKFHNRNIYAKLGVSSLKELMVYIKMMKETGDGK